MVSHARTGINRIVDPGARAGKSGAIEVFENNHVPVFCVVTRWVSLGYSSESDAAMLDMRARRG